MQQNKEINIIIDIYLFVIFQHKNSSITHSAQQKPKYSSRDFIRLRRERRTQLLGGGTSNLWSSLSTVANDVCSLAGASAQVSQAPPSPLRQVPPGTQAQDKCREAAPIEGPEPDEFRSQTNPSVQTNPCTHPPW